MLEPGAELHPEAEAEFLAAVRWYLDRSAPAAAAFVAEVDRARALIQEAPERWPKHRAGTRCFILRRFPYSIVYLPSRPPFIVAVAYHKRRPGYWRQRSQSAG